MGSLHRPGPVCFAPLPSKQKQVAQEASGSMFSLSKILPLIASAKSSSTASQCVEPQRNHFRVMVKGIRSKFRYHHCEAFIRSATLSSFTWNSFQLLSAQLKRNNLRPLQRADIHSSPKIKDFQPFSLRELAQKFNRESAFLFGSGIRIMQLPLARSSAAFAFCTDWIFKPIQESASTAVGQPSASDTRICVNLSFLLPKAPNRIGTPKNSDNIAEHKVSIAVKEPEG